MDKIKIMQCLKSAGQTKRKGLGLVWKNTRYGNIEFMTPIFFSYNQIKIMERYVSSSAICVQLKRDFWMTKAKFILIHLYSILHYQAHHNVIPSSKFCDMRHSWNILCGIPRIPYWSSVTSYIDLIKIAICV